MADDITVDKPGTDPDPIAGGAKFTDADMAAARKSIETKWQKKVDAAASRGAQTLLADLGHDTVDDLREALERVEANATASDDVLRENKKLKRDLDGRNSSYADLETRLGGMIASANSTKMEKAIYDAATKVNANPKLAFALAKSEGRIGVDEDGEVVVRDASGEPLHGMTVEKFVAQMVADEPTLKQPSPGVGSGTRTSSQRATSTGNGDPSSRDAQLANLVAQLAAKGITA